MFRKRIRRHGEVRNPPPLPRSPSIRKPPSVGKPSMYSIHLDELMTIPFSTTAMARPEIVERTYSSFTQNMEFMNFKASTLYLNIDPLPVDGDRQQVIDVAKKFFGNVIVNLPNAANFTNAVNWCWQQAGSDPLGYFFHLEDDWVLTRKININEVRKILLSKYNCGMVNLRAYSSINDGRICLSPCLIKSHFAKEITKVLDPRFNPEKQMRKRSRVNAHGGKTPVGYLSVQYPTNPRLIAIEDIGRSWIQSSKYERPIGEGFVTWKEKN